MTAKRIRQQPLAPSRGRKVLVFSFRGWYPHTAWDAMLAHALRLRGTDVHVFTCGGPLPICEVNFRHGDPRIACAECALYPDEILRSFSLPQSHLRDYVTPEELAAIRAQVAALGADELESWIYAGQPIGDLVRTSVLWFARKGTLDLTGNDARVYRDFLVSGASVAVMGPRLVKALEPDVVLELNGQFFAERILNRCLPAETPIVAYEAGWRSNTLGFDHVGPAGPVNLDASWQESRDVALTSREEQELDQWIRSRAGGDMQRDFYVKFSSGFEDPVAALGLNPNLPTAVLFTNLVWDTAVQGRNRAFNSIRDWLLSTIAYFSRRTDRQLIVRIHPAEELRPSQPSVEKLSEALRGCAMPDNVRVVEATNPLSSYLLMDRCDIALVYNSTAGLEAALRAKPVVVSAHVYYAGRGFTLDVDVAADYAQILDGAFAQRSLAPHQVQVARRFAHLLMFRYLHRIPVVHQRPGTLPLLDADEVELLLPAMLPDFDRVIAGIADGQPFVAPPTGEPALR